MSRDLIAVGKHRARCRSIALGYTNNGKEQAAIEFELIDPGDSDHGRSIAKYAFFSEGALQYTVADLRALGWTGVDPAELPDLAATGKLGNEVEIVVVHDTYNGKTSAKVKYVNKIGGVKLANPMDDGERKEFGASMRRQIAALSGDAYEDPPASSGGGYSGSVNPEDDIPFATCELADIDPIRRSRWP